MALGWGWGDPWCPPVSLLQPVFRTCSPCTDKSHPAPHCYLMPHDLKGAPRQEICWCGKISRNILKIWQGRGKELLLSMCVRISNNLFTDKWLLSSLQSLVGTRSGWRKEKKRKKLRKKETVILLSKIFRRGCCPKQPYYESHERMGSKLGNFENYWIQWS